MNMTHKHNCNHMQTKLNHTQTHSFTCPPSKCATMNQSSCLTLPMYIICALWRGAIVNGPCAPVPSCVPLAPFNLNNS